jgi:PrtD family type I secretion system ABC transporter
MPIRLEYLLAAEIPSALRDIRAAHLAKRRERQAQVERAPLHERMAELIEQSRSWKRWVAPSSWPIIRDVARAIEHSMRSAREFTKSVAASDVLNAAWNGVRTHLWLIFAFSAGINLLYLAPSLYMMQVYDRVLPTGGMLTLLMLSVVLVVSLAIMASLDALRGRLLARASLRVERLASVPILQQSMAARRYGMNSPNAPGIRDLDTMRAGLSSPAMIGVLDIPWTPLFIFICFVIHFWIGMLALAGAAIIATLALVNERASRASLSAVSQTSPRFYAAHDSDLAMAETAHALGADVALIQRRLGAREALAEAQTKASFDNSAYSSLTKSVRMLLQSAALGLGCYLAIEQMISAGAIIAATILTARAFAPVEAIVGGWRQLALGWTSFQQLRRAFEQTPRVAERTPLPAPNGRIALEGVSATVAGGRTPVLQNVSFAAGPGEIIGIIGPSGAGKSTLARVLANASLPQAGAIRVDGARYSDWEQTALARHIGYLPQRVDLFDGTITENISCFAGARGEPLNVVGPAAVEAAQLAGTHELILGLPNGYETVLALGGAGISPGQAQRIALARALFGCPKIIVLDEPNAHLDSEGESALARALIVMRQRGSVCFVVAHRAGVINIADKVLVMKEGRVVDYGLRNETLARLAPPPQQLRPVPALQPVAGEWP